MYIVIHQTHVPTVKHTEEVHIQYDSTCETNCSLPHGIVELKKQRSINLFRGQSYRFVIELEMPESETNYKQGMFMLRLRLILQGRSLHDSSRPTTLRYKSRIIRTLSALFYSPFLITNYKNEMQTLQVQLIDNYIEGYKYRFETLDIARLDVLARDIQIYSCRLHIIANLTGLKYFMHNWPVISAISGIIIVASIMIFLTFYQGDLIY